jgi:hypothetical protein
MNIIFKSKVWGIVATLAVVALFLSFSLVLANTAGKPVKWMAIILPSENLQGCPSPDQVYVSGENGINISTGTSRCGTGKTMTFYSYINFKVMLPSQIMFTLGTLVEGWSDPDLVKCGFPIGGPYWPLCLANFLSQPQPYEGYQDVTLRFCTAACEDRVSSNFTQMEVGSWLKTNMVLYIESQQDTGTECPEDCNPDKYHLVRARARGYIPEGQLRPDIYISRDSENEWTVYVDTNFLNPDYQYPDDIPYMSACDLIYEQYCVCVPKTGKGGKTFYGKEFKDAAWTKTNLKFQIKFIKTQ